MSDEKNVSEPSGASGGSLEWVPVTERLPDLGRRKVVRYVTVELHSDPVLTFGDGEQCVATYGDADGWLSVDNVLLDSVTHWMPLPAPPTDAK